MFSTKKQQLFSSKKTGGNESVSTIPKNPFIRAGLKKSLTTTALGNGAVKYWRCCRFEKQKFKT